MKPAEMLFCSIALLVGTAGCDRQSSSQTVKLGRESVVVDSESGKVRVFLIDSAGNKSLLADTGASHRSGWSLQQTDSRRLKLTTGSVGNFNIQYEATGWAVVPEGTFVSPSGDRIVRLRESGSNVMAYIGESGPPYTDISNPSAVTLTGTSLQGLDVRWMSGDEAHVVDASGKAIAFLKHKERAKEVLGSW